MNVRIMKFISSLSYLNSLLASDPAAALFVSLTLGFVIQNTVGPLQIKNTTIYRNDPKFSDIQVWAVGSGTTLFAILSASFGYITTW